MSIPWSKEQLMKANAKLMVQVKEQQNEIEELNGQYIGLQELLFQTEKDNKELISLNLWSARRLHPILSKFAYDELDKITGEKHERLR